MDPWQKQPKERQNLRKKCQKTQKSSFSPEQNLSFLLLNEIWARCFLLVLDGRQKKDGEEEVWRGGVFLWLENKNRSITHSLNSNYLLT